MIDPDQKQNTNDETEATENDQSEESEEVSSEEEVEEGIELLPEADPVVVELEDKLGKANSEISELTARLRSVSVAYKKQQDDIAATKERLERNMNYREARRRGEVVKILFEPVENLRRSIDAMVRAEVDSSHVEGLNFTLKSFMDGFHKLGLEELSPMGEKFDPNKHQALMQMPVDDPNLHDVVTQVHSAGYQIEGILLKPAQVLVGFCANMPKKVEEADSSEESAEEEASVENETTSDE